MIYFIFSSNLSLSTTNFISKIKMFIVPANAAKTMAAVTAAIAVKNYSSNIYALDNEKGFERNEALEISSILQNNNYLYSWTKKTKLPFFIEVCKSNNQNYLCIVAKTMEADEKEYIKYNISKTDSPAAFCEHLTLGRYEIENIIKQCKDANYFDKKTIDRITNYGLNLSWTKIETEHHDDEDQKKLLEELSQSKIKKEQGVVRSTWRKIEGGKRDFSNLVDKTKKSGFISLFSKGEVATEAVPLEGAEFNINTKKEGDNQEYSIFFELQSDIVSWYKNKKQFVSINLNPTTKNGMSLYIVPLNVRHHKVNQIIPYKDYQSGSEDTSIVLLNMYNNIISTLNDSDLCQTYIKIVCNLANNLERCLENRNKFNVFVESFINKYNGKSASNNMVMSKFENISTQKIYDQLLNGKPELLLDAFKKIYFFLKVFSYIWHDKYEETSKKMATTPNILLSKKIVAIIIELFSERIVTSYIDEPKNFSDEMKYIKEKYINDNQDKKIHLYWINNADSGYNDMYIPQYAVAKNENPEEENSEEDKKNVFNKQYFNTILTTTYHTVDSGHYLVKSNIPKKVSWLSELSSKEKSDIQTQYASKLRGIKDKYTKSEIMSNKRSELSKSNRIIEKLEELGKNEETKKEIEALRQLGQESKKELTFNQYIEQIRKKEEANSESLMSKIKEEITQSRIRSEPKRNRKKDQVSKSEHEKENGSNESVSEKWGRPSSREDDQDLSITSSKQRKYLEDSLYDPKEEEVPILKQKNLKKKTSATNPLNQPISQKNDLTFSENEENNGFEENNILSEFFKSNHSSNAEVKDNKIKNNNKKQPNSDEDSDR